MGRHHSCRPRPGTWKWCALPGLTSWYTGTVPGTQWYQARLLQHHVRLDHPGTCTGWQDISRSLSCSSFIGNVKGYCMVRWLLQCTMRQECSWQIIKKSKVMIIILNRSPAPNKHWDWFDSRLYLHLWEVNTKRINGFPCVTNFGLIRVSGDAPTLGLRGGGGGVGGQGVYMSPESWIVPKFLWVKWLERKILRLRTYHM